MTKKERNEALRSLWLKAQMLFALVRAVWSGQVLSMNVELRGSVLLDYGICAFGGRLADCEMKAEPDEDENGPFAFLVAQMDGIEILQIDDNYEPEDGE